MTVVTRRDLILDYKQRVHRSEWTTPDLEPVLVDAILYESRSRTVPFNIDESPYFGQVFNCRLNVRKDWVASAALFCWPGRHLCSGGQIMYTMAGLFSFLALPEAWHLEFQPGYDLKDRVTICRLVPD